ncbi:hypothetical protein B0H67DRAFT_28116 [Lasiosphaeris hirsuta]|uniref:Uncharacterized protein n=1 Tax=Lasiosphaeris hirsuta TaxID=260670 RepID=A0AA40B9U9_9PEZI|nr:hypothetical protein B0H67DRAFT_28116 [Lasiosphaeris hirsuta]
MRDARWVLSCRYQGFDDASWTADCESPQARIPSTSLFRCDAALFSSPSFRFLVIFPLSTSVVGVRLFAVPLWLFRCRSLAQRSFFLLIFFLLLSAASTPGPKNCLQQGGSPTRTGNRNKHPTPHNRPLLPGTGLLVHTNNPDRH